VRLLPPSADPELSYYTFFTFFSPTLTAYIPLVRVSVGLRSPDTNGCLSHSSVNDDATITPALSGSPLRHL